MRAILRWGNLIFFIAMVIVNVLANMIPIGGHTTGEVSAAYPTLFTPAPYTFAIWGLIYLMMCIFVIYGAILGGSRPNVLVMLDRVSIFFILSCMLNILWIFAWHTQRVGLSVVCIIGLLLLLILINIRFRVYPDIPFLERLCVYGFELYLGWICAATIANISVLLVKNHWSGFGLSDQIWMIVILLVTCLLGCSFSLVGGRFMASIAILWALGGIFVNHISKAGYHNAYPLISFATACIIISILLCILLSPIVRKVYPSPEADDWDIP